MQIRQIPVFLFTGFLDSGKTKFIQDTLSEDKFVAGKSTLLIVCEEGEEEYDPYAFASPKIYLERIEEEDDLSTEYLLELSGKHDIDQVMIEYNGMWRLDSLYRNLPPTWAVAQEFAFFDSTTILTYNANMRAQTVDKLQSCDLAIFNRVERGSDVMPFHKLVRGISRTADIIYDHPDGGVERDDIEDPMPFDVTAPIIEIADTDFALWYTDLGEKLSFYEGKTVKFKAMVARDPSLKKDEIVVGRKIMTCCADDVAYSGLVCRSEGAAFYAPLDWVMVTAKIKLEKHPVYRTAGPVLVATSLARTSKPSQEIVMYY